LSRFISKKVAWLVIVLTAVLLFVACAFIHKKKTEVARFDDIAPWETVGFVPEELPVTAASTIRVMFNEDGTIFYNVYLPWNEDDSIKVICDEAISLTVGGVEYHNGDSFSIPALTDVEGVISVPGVGEYAGTFRFIGTSGIPSIHLGLYNDSEEFLSETKGNTATGYCTILDDSEKQDFAGNCSIRIHGNTSWYNDKKSYQLSLEEDASILGMGAQRKWLLISEFVDRSFLKDAIMYQLARNSGDEHAPEFRFVNVYLNGRYNGLYLMTQKIGIEGGTLSDLNDLEAENSLLQGEGLLQNITGGYLVELGVLEAMQRDEGETVFESPNRYMRVKSPNNITEEELAYLSGLVMEAEEALYLPDGEVTDDGKTWSSYYDADTWVREYLLQEISANYDTEYASSFFYVKENDPTIYGGPGWDFDRAINDYIQFIQNESLDFQVRALHNNAIRVFEKNESGVLWLRQLDSHEDFHDRMKESFFNTMEPELSRIITEDVPMWQQSIADSVAADAILWHEGEWSKEARDGYAQSYASSVPDAVQGMSDRLKALHEYYEHEDEYSLVTFVIPECRFDLVVPVKTGETIGSEVLPIYKDSMDWYDGDELFTTQTVVTKDIVLSQKD